LRVRYFSRNRLAPEVEFESGGAVYCNSLEELLSGSDIVSVNCPLNTSTTGLLGSKEFGQMKDGVFFVNTARGAIVDELALIEALETGKVCRAGLDVFPAEPNIK